VVSKCSRRLKFQRDSMVNYISSLLCVVLTLALPGFAKSGPDSAGPSRTASQNPPSTSTGLAGSKMGVNAAALIDYDDSQHMLVNLVKSSRGFASVNTPYGTRRTAPLRLIPTAGPQKTSAFISSLLPETR
jgi:hypothetical protein